MPVIRMKDLAKIYPFTQVTGLLGRNEKKKALEQMKEGKKTETSSAV